jgi:hypothetical protein
MTCEFNHSDDELDRVPEQHLDHGIHVNVGSGHLSAPNRSEAGLLHTFSVGFPQFGP